MAVIQALARNPSARFIDGGSVNLAIGDVVVLQYPTTLNFLDIYVAVPASGQALWRQGLDNTVRAQVGDPAVSTDHMNPVHIDLSEGGWFVSFIAQGGAGVYHLFERCRC